MDISEDQHSNKCLKTQKYYKTCKCISWEIAKLIHYEKENRNLDEYSMSDLIDDLIAKKSKEVFCHTQK